MRANTLREVDPFTYVRFILLEVEGEVWAVEGDGVLGFDDMLEVIARVVLCKESTRELNTHDGGTRGVEEVYQA